MEKVISNFMKTLTPRKGPKSSRVPYKVTMIQNYIMYLKGICVLKFWGHVK